MDRDRPDADERGDDSTSTPARDGEALARRSYRRAVIRELEREARGEGELASIVVPVLDNADLTRRAVAALTRSTVRPFELILVDNGSGPEAAALCAELARDDARIVCIRNERNEGFAYAANQGLARARGKHVVVMNNDVLVTPGWLSRLVALVELESRVGIAGPRTNRASGPQQMRTVEYDQEHPENGGLDAFAARVGEACAGQFAFLPRLVGLCMLFKRAVLDEIGGFDTCFGYGNFEDDDLCLRAQRRGYKLAMAGDVFIHHHGSATFRSTGLDYGALMRRNWAWFCAKWDHRGPLGPYPATTLARRRPFVRSRDHVPVAFDAVYHPGAEPIELDAARGWRALAIVEPGRDDDLALLHAYCAAFGPEDDATLVLRLDPPVHDEIANAERRILSAMAACSRDASTLPDVLIDATTILPARRGGLYTAVSALLLPERGDPFHEREARACGIDVLRDVSAESLRDVRSRILAP